MNDWPAYLLERRARWLGELAFAGGDADRQKGWADYVKAEREALDIHMPGASKIAYARFKELSTQKE